MLQWAHTFVASLCSQCFICFLQTYVASVFVWTLHMFLHICCKCFYLNVAYVLQWVSTVFMCFCKCFRCMFQVFHLPSNVCYKCWYLDVSKVDEVASPSSLFAASPQGLILLSRCRLGICRPLPIFLDGSDVWGYAGSSVGVRMPLVRAFRRPGATKPDILLWIKRIGYSLSHSLTLAFKQYKQHRPPFCKACVTPRVF